MKKTVTANISGQFFHIDEDAYEKLSRYLSAIRHYFSQQEGCDEILNDIEQRVAEMLKEKVSDQRQVVTISDVDEVVKIMGQPEDYLEGAEPGSIPPPPVYMRETKRRIFRNPDDKVLGGVCGGLGAYFDVDPLWIRLIWVFMFFVAGFGFLLYIILWIIIPEARTASEKLAMRGEPINVDNISKAVKDEMEGVGDRIKSTARDFGKKEGAGQARKVVHEFFELLGNLVGLLGKAIVKVFGVIFIAISLAFLITLVVFVFTDKLMISINDGGVSWLSYDQVMEYLLPAGMDKVLVLITVFLLLIAPLVGLLVAGVKMLFNIRYKIPFAGTFLGILFISGLALASYIAVKTVSDFSDRAFTVKEQTLQIPGDTLYVQMQSGELPPNADLVMGDDGRTFLAMGQNSMYIGNVHLNVLRSTDSLFHIETNIRSRGETNKEAAARVASVRFNPVLSDSLLSIPEGLIIQASDQFRNQKARINILVPEGKTVYLNTNTSEFLDDVKNLQNMWDGRMGDKYWTMTTSGLSCLACSAETTRDY